MEDTIIATAAIGIIGAVLGAIAGGLGTYYIEKLKIRNTDFQKRQQVFSHLMGLKFITCQLYSSTYQAKLLFDYGKASERISCNQVDKEDRRQETLRLRNELVDLINEIAKTQQELWENIGLILILFPSTTTLNEKIAPLAQIQEHFKNFEHRDIDKLKGTDLDSWKKTTKKEISETIKQRIEKPLDDLLNYLKGEIDKEVLGLAIQPCELRCCLCRMP